MNNEDNNIDDETFQLIKVYIAQTQSALKISKIICEHSERDELTGDDILCGLIYRLMNPMTQDEINDSLIKADEILEDNYSSEEEDIEIEKEIIEKNEIRKIVSNNCNCDICIQMRVNLINYNTYECTDILSERFNNSIKETCKKYKLII
tara:strand:+ start:84 stop:533 length:450 start_codon:yes stop_codon:yes gene_type:complete